MDSNLELDSLVQNQLKPCQVLDPNVLQLMRNTPRELFVPASFKSLAYAATEIPLGHEQHMLNPTLIGQILQALELNGHEQVLEIGTGSGYLTYLLANLSNHVSSVEINTSLAAQASKRLASLGQKNIEIICGNAFTILKGAKAFDALVLTGSVPSLPNAVIQQAKIGGRLFAVIGQAPLMHACIFTRINEEESSKTTLFETVVPPLRELANAPNFEF
jgi:protein-L-isoaspartate(D-aspartate) O-methyltransferase